VPQTYFLSPYNKALRGGQPRQETRNTASFVSSIYSERKNAWTVGEPSTEMVMGETGKGAGATLVPNTNINRPFFLL
jgi:hypothetical protein